MIQINNPSRKVYEVLLVEANKMLIESFVGYPYNYCEHGSRFSNLVFGFEEVGGEAVGFEKLHAWNYDPRTGLYLDLTYGQFVSSRCGLITTTDTELLVPNKKHTDVVRQNKDSDFTNLRDVVVDFEARFNRRIKHLI